MTKFENDLLIANATRVAAADKINHYFENNGSDIRIERLHPSATLFPIYEKEKKNKISSRLQESSINEGMGYYYELKSKTGKRIPIILFTAKKLNLYLKTDSNHKGQPLEYIRFLLALNYHILIKLNDKFSSFIPLKNIVEYPWKLSFGKGRGNTNRININGKSHSIYLSTIESERGIFQGTLLKQAETLLK